MNKLVAIVLAAGEGTRMKSKKAKVLHHIAGKPMISYVLSSLNELGLHRIIVVVGRKREDVQRALKHCGNVEFVVQEEQLGTGHAVLATKETLETYDDTLLLLSGDVPLLSCESLKAFYEFYALEKSEVAILSSHLDDPFGYGRVIKDKSNRVIKIVEEKDATNEEREVREINGGIYLIKSKLLFEALEQVDSDNRQGEFYLTDVMEILGCKGRKISTFSAVDPDEIIGVNNKLQLSVVEGIIRKRIRNGHMLNGVTLVQPESVSIDESVVIGADTEIHPYVIAEGNSHIGANCVIGPYSRIVDSEIGEGSELKGWNYLCRISLPQNTILEPFAQRFEKNRSS